MNKTVKRCIVCALILVLSVPVCIWIGALVKNAVLTVMHKEQVENIRFVEPEELQMDWYRITSYSDDSIEIYYVNTLSRGEAGEYKIGERLTFRKMTDGWHHTGGLESILWSGAGTAEHYIWPYWYHVFLVWF